MPCIGIGTFYAVVITVCYQEQDGAALNSNFTGIMTLDVSGSLSAHHQEFLAVHRLWYI